MSSAPPSPPPAPPKGIRSFTGKDWMWMILGPLIVLAAYHTWGWKGVALATGAGLMWALLHLTRMMITLRKATARPKGWVSSAIMLQSRVHPGMTMLQLVQLTGAFGDCVQASDGSTDTEIWRWTDDGGDAVEVRLERSKVRSASLIRKTEDH